MLQERLTSIVGARYHEGAQDGISQLEQGQKLTLIREPNNKHDKNACAIYCDTQMLGYIPRDNAVLVAEFVDAGKLVVVKSARRLGPERIAVLYDLEQEPQPVRTSASREGIQETPTRPDEPIDPHPDHSSLDDVKDAENTSGPEGATSEEKPADDGDATGPSEPAPTPQQQAELDMTSKKESEVKDGDGTAPTPESPPDPATDLTREEQVAAKQQAAAAVKHRAPATRPAATTKQ